MHQQTVAVAGRTFACDACMVWVLYILTWGTAHWNGRELSTAIWHLYKIPLNRRIQHQTQTDLNAGDLNERERILRIGVGCVYPPVGMVSLIRA
jgi:hypothetical protein